MRRKMVITFLLFVLIPLYSNDVSGNNSSEYVVRSDNRDVKSLFNPLKTFFKQCKKGMNAFIAGENAKTAFAPLDTSVNTDANLRKFREKLKKYNVSGVGSIILELEPVLFQARKPLLYIRTEIFVDEFMVGLFSIEARRPGSLILGKPLSGYTGSAAPFKESAMALYKIISSGDKCKMLPFVPVKYFSKIAKDPGLREKLIKTVERSKQKLDRICATIAGLNADRFQLRIDDVAHLAIDKSGKLIGLIKTGLRLFPDGRLGIYLNSFRPFKE